MALVLLWGGALLVMINDIDFFDFHDLFDTTEPHHEHIVVALLVAGVIAAAWPILRDRRAATSERKADLRLRASPGQPPSGPLLSPESRKDPVSANSRAVPEDRIRGNSGRERL